MQNIKIGAMLIGVSDLNNAKPFYEKVFNIETVEFRPPFMQGKLGDNEFNIEEDTDHRSKDWAKHNIGGRKSFTFQVEDIFKFIENAENEGATIIEKPIKQKWGWYDAVISDPDKNEFVIEQEIRS